MNKSICCPHCGNEAKVIFECRNDDCDCLWCPGCDLHMRCPVCNTDNPKVIPPEDYDPILTNSEVARSRIMNIQEYEFKGFHTLETANTLVQMCRQINSFLEIGQKTAIKVNLNCFNLFDNARECMKKIEKSPAVVQAHAFLDGYHARGEDDKKLPTCAEDDFPTEEK